MTAWIDCWIMSSIVSTHSCNLFLSFLIDYTPNQTTPSKSFFSLWHRPHNWTYYCSKMKSSQLPLFRTPTTQHTFKNLNSAFHKHTSPIYTPLESKQQIDQDSSNTTLRAGRRFLIVACQNPPCNHRNAYNDVTRDKFSYYSCSSTIRLATDRKVVAFCNDTTACQHWSFVPGSTPVHVGMRQLLHEVNFTCSSFCRWRKN